MLTREKINEALDWLYVQQPHNAITTIRTALIDALKRIEVSESADTIYWRGLSQRQ